LVCFVNDDQISPGKDDRGYPPLLKGVRSANRQPRQDNGFSAVDVAWTPTINVSRRNKEGRTGAANVRRHRNMNGAPVFNDFIGLHVIYVSSAMIRSLHFDGNSTSEHITGPQHQLSGE
jgi:hypothetical protein